LYSTQRSRRIAGLQAGAVGPGRYLWPIRPPVRSKVPSGSEMPTAPPAHAAVPRRRDSTGDVVSDGSLATALGCAQPGRKGTREHLQKKITTRHEGRLEDTHGAASPGAHRRRIDGAGLAAALGCARLNLPHNPTYITRLQRLEVRLTGWRDATDCAGRHGLASRSEPANARPQQFTSVEQIPGAGVCMVTAHALPFPPQGRHGTKAVHRTQATTARTALGTTHVAG
jgi:hypothetical protein